MTKRHAAVPVVFALLFGLGGSLFAGPSQRAALLQAGEPYPWMLDLDKARELAANQNKPLLLVFRCVP